EVRARVTNTGDRAGREIVQVYLAPREPGADHPARVLAGFAAAQAGPRETADAAVSAPRRAAESRDDGAHACPTVPGRHDGRVGRSYTDIRLSAPLGGA